MENTLFIRELSKDKFIEAVAPTSNYLANQIIEKINFENASTIVEYGPGDGVITKLLLDKMNPKARLFVFETNQNFIEKLMNMNDERLVVIRNDAENAKQILRQRYSIENVNCIVSTIPFSLIEKNKRSEIISDSFQLLQQNGQFITYQYSWLILSLIKQYFKNVKLEFIILDIPPAFIINCSK